MSKLINISDYEPLSSRKKSFLYLNNESRSIGKIKLPGLFNSYNYSTYKIIFFITVFYEIIIIFILWDNIQNLLYFLVPFILDFIIPIVFNQLAVKDIKESENKLIIAQFLEKTYHKDQNFKYSVDYFKRKILKNETILYFGDFIIAMVTSYKIYLTIIYFNGPLVVLIYLVCLIAIIAFFP
jgi:hypothetical protein